MTPNSKREIKAKAMSVAKYHPDGCIFQILRRTLKPLTVTKIGEIKSDIVWIRTQGLRETRSIAEKLVALFRTPKISER
jgi:hypothetical protein